MAGLPEIKHLTFTAVTQTLSGTGLSANCTLPEVGQVSGVEDGGLLRFSGELWAVVPGSDAILEVLLSKPFANNSASLGPIRFSCKV